MPGNMPGVFRILFPSRRYFRGAKLRNVPEYIKWKIRNGVFLKDIDYQGR